MDGWGLSDFDTYKETYERFGGSVCSHPDVISYLNEKVPSLSFHVYRRNGVPICAVYTTGKNIRAGHIDYPFVFDDIILPYKKNEKKIILPFRTKQLSPFHAGDFYNCIHWQKMKRKTCVVKDDFSVSTHKKRRLAFKKFLHWGGECRPAEDFSAEELSDIYCTLFELRWGDSLVCYSREILTEVFKRLRHLVFGHVLLINGKPCAYDLLFKAECIEWYFFDCINGGYDPDYAELSIGSVLMYLNIQKAKELCQAGNAKMIFSLGMDNPKWKYKKQWCNTLTLGRLLTL